MNCILFPRETQREGTGRLTSDSLRGSHGPSGPRKGRGRGSEGKKKEVRETATITVSSLGILALGGNLKALASVHSAVRCPGGQALARAAGVRHTARTCTLGPFLSWECLEGP